MEQRHAKVESRNENKGRLMEVPKHDLPLEWEERWRREKERRKKAIEDSGEGLEQANRELKWIVACNDSRTGLRSSFTGQQRSGVIDTGTSSGESAEHLIDQQPENEELVHIYANKSYPKDIFQVLEEFWRSSVLTDLTLVANGDRSFRVHWVVMAAISAFIKKQTKGHTKDGMRTLSLGPDVHRVGLRAMVEFAYTGSIRPLSSDGRALVRAAARALAAPRLLQRCDEEEKGMEPGGPGSEEEQEMELTLQAIKDLWTQKVGCDVILDVGGASFHGWFFNIFDILLLID